MKPLSEEEIAAGWIVHEGEGCPVDDDVIVEVSLKGIGKATKKDAKRAEKWIWSRNTKHPITAYRVVAYPVVDQGEALKAAVDAGVDKMNSLSKSVPDALNQGVSLDDLEKSRTSFVSQCEKMRELLAEAVALNAWDEVKEQRFTIKDDVKIEYSGHESVTIDGLRTGQEIMIGNSDGMVFTDCAGQRWFRHDMDEETGNLIDPKKFLMRVWSTFGGTALEVNEPSKEDKNKLPDHLIPPMPKFRDRDREQRQEFGCAQDKAMGDDKPAKDLRGLDRFSHHKTTYVTHVFYDVHRICTITNGITSWSHHLRDMDHALRNQVNAYINEVEG